MPINVHGSLQENDIRCPEGFFERCSGNLRIDGTGNELIIDQPQYLPHVDLSLRGSASINIGSGLHCPCLTIHAAAENSKITIGIDNLFNGAVRILAQEAGRITIGSECMFATGVEITCGDFHSIFDVETGIRLNPASDIIVEDHVWIGARASVLKGAIIGRDSIVGMGSIVTRQHPRNVVVAGVPAKVVKRGVTWAR